jgi:hypothetical protein
MQPVDLKTPLQPCATRGPAQGQPAANTPAPCPRHLPPQCFIQQGFLLPKFHVHYWMGLVSGINGAMWPNFTWLDHVEAVYMGNYQHWGTAGPGRLEPNNLVPQEDCAGSNLTSSYTNAGGWADHNCTERCVQCAWVGVGVGVKGRAPVPEPVPVRWLLPLRSFNGCLPASMGVREGVALSA